MKKLKFVDPTGQIATGVTGMARREKAFQKRLDSMQIAVLKGTVSLSNIPASAAKELEAVSKNRRTLAEMKATPVADLSELQRIADQDFKLVTEEGLAMEANAKAKKFEDRGLNVTDDQRLIIYRYYAIQARKNWEIVKQVRAFLALFHKKQEVVAPLQIEEAVLAN